MAKKTIPITAFSFDEAFKQLATVVANIEDDDTPLESLPDYIEKANMLLEQLNTKLRTIENNIELK
jgi:exodeoxyribonuclease VII small subunit